MKEVIDFISSSVPFSLLLVILIIALVVVWMLIGASHVRWISLWMKITIPVFLFFTPFCFMIFVTAFIYPNWWGNYIYWIVISLVSAIILLKYNRTIFDWLNGK